MAEIIGAIASGMTLAGLFKVCLDAIDLIQTARNQDLDMKKLVLKLNIEKCRLYAWGEAVGLTSIPASGQTRLLDACSDDMQELIRETLEMTICLFVDAQKLKQRYGCKELSPVQAGSPFNTCGNNLSSVDILTTPSSRSKVIDRSSDKIAQVALKTRWIIHDRKKFMELVAEVKAFVDGLRSLTQSLYPTIRQESRIKRGIHQIDDVETLDLIADVCEIDHPAIAETASERSCNISLASSRLRDVEQWISGVASEPEDDLSDIESLTVTELKHRVLLASRRQRGLEAAHLDHENILRTSIPLTDLLAMEVAGAALRESEKTRILTFLSLIFLPVSLITSLYGMSLLPT